MNPVSQLMEISDEFLEGLSVEQQTGLYVAYHSFVNEYQRVNDAFYRVCAELENIEGLLGQRFPRFVEKVLGLSDRTVRRWLKAYSAMGLVFQGDERAPLKITSNVSQGALQLLSSEPDQAIVEEVRALATSGRKVTEKTVKDLLDARDARLRIELDKTEAELNQLRNTHEHTLQTHQMEKETAELYTSRLREQLANSDRALQRVSEARNELERQVEELQTTRKEVITFVEKVPDGFDSAEDAIKYANQELKAKQAELERLNHELQERQKEKDRLEQEVGDVAEGSQRVADFSDRVDELIREFSVQFIETQVNPHPTMHKIIDRIASRLIVFGNELKSAVSAKT